MPWTYMFRTAGVTQPYREKNGPVFWYRKSEDNFGFGRPIKRYLIWLDSQKRYNIDSFPNLHAHHDLPAWVNESKLGDHFGPVNSAFFENISVQDSWNYNGPMILDILDEYTLQVRIYSNKNWQMEFE